VVTGDPIGSAHPSAVFRAWIGSPMGRPAPSSAAALTVAAFAIPRSITVPVTGSISDGDSPWLAVLVCASFHFKLVFDTRDPAVSSILDD